MAKEGIVAGLIVVAGVRNDGVDVVKLKGLFGSEAGVDATILDLFRRERLIDDVVTTEALPAF